MPELLTRDDFRNLVFERDHHTCVVCNQPAVDAHHIVERRLFADGGYYLDNGASLCTECHLQAEQTLISCELIRACCNVTTVVLPEHLYTDSLYDKWGNPLLTDTYRSEKEYLNARRLIGELFYDESVQKALRPVLHLFSKYVKHPRTYHLPWSEGYTDDDKIMNSTQQFWGKRVIVTEKMDGEQFTMYSDFCHARSLDSSHHPTRSWVKNLHARICYDIPTGWRVCGENLFAKHSIYYDDLPSYFLVHSIWDDKNHCLSWDDTVEYAEVLGLQTVPLLYDITYEKLIKELSKIIYNSELKNEHEGYVVRLAESFSYSAHRKSVGKFVRKNHVQTHGNWMREQITQNKLKYNKERLP